MRILFVHQNFPGQFVHLAPALMQRGHEVVGLTSRNFAPPPGIPIARYNWEKPPHDPGLPRFAATFVEMTRRGEVVARAASQLQDEHNFTPDIVFGTPGWGETIFLKEVFPDALHVLYAEFFYRTRGHLLGFDPEFSSSGLSSRIALTIDNAHLLLSINAADRFVAPTHWQARSFPATVQPRMTVIHDGIDTALASPGEVQVTLPGTSLTLKTGDEILTFINRNLERHRGFHIFMRALPEILRKRPEAHAVIIGGDGESYSPKPASGKSWKQHMLDEVGGRLDLSRVHFVGHVPHAMFLDLMRVSRVHAYLTYPFVLSWSLLEAMSAEALIVASRTAPVEEVIDDGVNGRLVDFFDIAAWSETLIDALAAPGKYNALRRAARRTIVKRYDLQSLCLPRQISFLEGLEPKHGCKRNSAGT